MTPTEFTYAPWWSSNVSPVPVSLEGFEAGDLIAYTIRTQRTFWELDLLEYVGMVGPEGGVYLDVGGNIGNHAVFFGKFCADHVVSFEPHPRLQPILRGNLERNGLGARSTAVGIALGAEEGSGVMKLREGYEGNIGASHVASGPSVNIDGATIPIRTLDGEVARLRKTLHHPITFLKIDVEGMELEVLKGAMKTLEEHRPQLLVELITPEAHAAATQLLSKFGYREVAKLSDPPSCHFIDPKRHVLRENRWHGGTYHTHQVKLAEEEIAAATPGNAVLIVADSDEMGFGPTVRGRNRIPFTEQNGVFFGAPADDAHAIGELERLRRAGATHFVLAAPALWYLDTYKRFAERLGSLKRLAETQRVIVYEL